VEDPVICHFVRVILGRRSYEVLEAEAHRAQRILEAESGEVLLVITNVPEEFEAFRDRLRILYLAACPDQELAGRFPCCRALRKPFHPKDLLAAIEELNQREL
jgi:hypothetical protein